MKPQRIQLSRKAGFNLQAVSLALNGLPAVNCARPSRFGNPFVVKFDPHSDYTPQTAAEAVKLFRAHVDKGLMRIKIRQELRGKNLACWCHLWQCPKCKHYCDLWPDSKGPHCGCDGDTVMLRVPCHCDILLSISNT